MRPVAVLLLTAAVIMLLLFPLLVRFARREPFTVDFTVAPARPITIRAAPDVPWPDAIQRAARLYPASLRLRRDGPPRETDWVLTDAWSAPVGMERVAVHPDVEKVIIAVTHLPGSAEGVDARSPPAGWSRPVSITGDARALAVVGDLGGALVAVPGPADARLTSVWHRPRIEAAVTVPDEAAGFVHYMDPGAPCDRCPPGLVPRVRLVQTGKRGDKKLAGGHGLVLTSPLVTLRPRNSG